MESRPTLGQRMGKGVDGFVLVGNLLVFIALLTTMRTDTKVRPQAWRAVILIVFGWVTLLVGQAPQVMMCAVLALSAGTLMLGELTSARRFVLVIAWTVTGVLLIVLNLRQEQAGEWIADMKPWIAVGVLPLIAWLAVGATSTALITKDPDAGPGGV
jgi:uncharacterized membrane protein